MNRFAKPHRARDAEHSIVYRNAKEFCSWVFLGGLWRTADGSLVIAFKRADVDYGDAKDIHHDNLAVLRGRLVSLRSTDNGNSWDVGTLQDVSDLTLTAEQIEAKGPSNYDAEGPVDFLSKDVLIVSGSTPASFTPKSKPYIKMSADGGRSWRRPIILPMSGLGSLSGQGSTMVRSDGMSLIALTSVTPDGWTRRPLLYASPDGTNYSFLSFMTPQDDDGQAVSDKVGSPRFGAHRYFYPRPMQLKDGRLLASMRCQRDPTSILWTEMFESEDGGRTWRFISRVNDWGAPGDIAELSDGRIICVYGYRLAPSGVRYRVSEDKGRTWSSEIILRDDGANWDCGYPRVIEVAPGKCLTAYYINVAGDPIGVRHIAQTVFTPE